MMNNTRLYLTRMLKILSLIGAILLLYTLFASLFVSNPARGNAQISVNLAKLRPGEVRLVSELSEPVIILHRTNEMVSSLEQTSNYLHPSNTSTSTASHTETTHPEYFIAVARFNFINRGTGISNQLDIKHKPATNEATYCSGKSVEWQGGFVDSAGRDICFDYAGRVYNYEGYKWLDRVDDLEIPEYEFTGGGWVRIWLSD